MGTVLGALTRRVTDNWITAGAGTAFLTKAEASFTRRKDASLGSLFV